MPSSEENSKAGVSIRDLAIPLVVIVVGGAVLFANHQRIFAITLHSTALLGTALAILVYLCKKRPVRFGAGLASFLLVGFLITHVDSSTIHTERNFFGVLRIDREKQRPAVALFHGHTSHGRQFLDPKVRQEPTTYYHRKGPLGEIFSSLPPAAEGRRVAVIGLGAGTVACYAKQKDHWVFYEINPQVTKLAKDANYFTFLNECSAKVDVISGDGRLSLAKAPDGYFDLILLDAFSSDSIPVHLLTTEALQLYLKKLQPHGIVAFHISNRYLKLDSVLANLAASCGLPGYGMVQVMSQAEEKTSLGSSSAWGVVARNDADLRKLVGQYPGWRRLNGGRGAHAWTDDYSSLITYLNVQR